MAHPHPARRRRGRPAALLGPLLLAPVGLAHSPHDVVNEFGVSTEAGQPVAIFASTQLTDHRLLARSLDGGETWSLHALPVADRGVSDVVLSPSFSVDGTVFIATTDAGLVRSVDRGDHFVSLQGNGLPVNLHALALLGDFATTGDMVCGTPFGLYTSGDGGTTFTLGGAGLTESKIVVLASAKDGGQQVVFGGGKTFARSVDRGASWTPLHTFPQRMRSLAVSPRFGQDHTALVSLDNDGGVFVTTNGGATWLPMVTGLAELAVPEVGVADDGSLFVVTQTDGLHRAAGPLARWTKVVAPGFEQLSDLTSDHFRGLAVGPGYAASGTLFVGSFEGFYITDDDCASFRQGDVYGQGYNRRVVPAPDYLGGGTLFVVNYGGGLYRTPAVAGGGASGSVPAPTPGGGSHGAGTVVGAAHQGPQAPPPQVWSSLSRGVGALFGQCLELSPDYLADGTMYYAQSGLYRSSDRGETWSELPLPLGVPVLRAVALSPGFAIDRLVLIGAGLTGGLFRSTDAGETWSDSSSGLPPVSVPSELRFSPAYPSDGIVFAATKGEGVFRSDDGGLTWTSTGAGITDGTIRSFELSPDFANDRTLYAGTSEQGLFRSTDGGDTWLPADAGISPGLPRAIESIALSPQFASDGVLYVANLYDGVWRSDDRGDTWTKIGGAGLPPDPPRVVTVAPGFPADPTVLVSTNSWIFRSVDAGQTFERLPGYNRYDDLDYRMVEEGDWTEVAVSDGHGPTVTEAQLAGSTLTFHVSGDSLRWHARRGPDMGIARVTVDGGPPTLVDLYAPEASKIAPVFERTFDAVGFHEIAILVTGGSHPLSLGTRVVSDGFDATF